VARREESEEARRQREDIEKAQSQRLEELRAEKETTVGKLAALEAEKRALREKLLVAAGASEAKSRAVAGGGRKTSVGAGAGGVGGGGESAAAVGQGHHREEQHPQPTAARSHGGADEGGGGVEGGALASELTVTEAEREALSKAQSQKLAVTKAATEAEARASELRAKYEALLRAKKRPGWSDAAAAGGNANAAGAGAGAPPAKKGRYRLDLRPTTISVKLPEGTPPGAGEEVAKHLGTLAKVSQWSGGASTEEAVLVGFADRAAAEAAFVAANKGVHEGAATVPTQSFGDLEVTLSWTNAKPAP
jgi:hypothetical protein